MRSSGSSRMSAIWTTRPSTTTRPATVRRVAGKRASDIAAARVRSSSRDILWWATGVTRWPSNRNAIPNAASQSRVALCTIASKTGCTSVGELEITLRISLVAVCCSSASVTFPCAWVNARFFSCSSVNSRTFSMAMTAWSAKVWRSAICLSVNGTASRRVTLMAPIGSPSRNIGTDSMARKPSSTKPLSSYSGSAAMSAVCAMARVRIARAVTVPGPGSRGNACWMASRSLAVQLW